MKAGIAQLHELMAAARQAEVDFKQNERLVDILNKAQAIKVLNPELVELMLRIKPDERDIKTKLYRSVVNHLIKVVSAASKPGDKRRELQRIEKQFKSREAKYHIDAMRQLARLSQKRMSEVDASLLKKAATFKFQENSKKDNKEYSYSPTRPDYDATTRSPDKKHKYSKKEDKEDSYSPTRPDYDGTARTPDKNHVLELYDEIKALPNKAPEQLAEFYNERANVALEYVNQMLDPRLSREDKLHIVQDVKEMYENEQLGVPQNLSKLTSNMQTADNQEEILKGIAAVSKDLRKHLNPPRRNIDKLADMLRQMEN
jgi:type III secretion system FlhB-like substrate exporter